MRAGPIGIPPVAVRTTQGLGWSDVRMDEEPPSPEHKTIKRNPMTALRNPFLKFLAASATILFFALGTMAFSTNVAAADVAAKSTAKKAVKDVDLAWDHVKVTIPGDWVAFTGGDKMAISRYAREVFPKSSVSKDPAERVLVAFDRAPGALASVRIATNQNPKVGELVALAKEHPEVLEQVRAAYGKSLGTQPHFLETITAETARLGGRDALRVIYAHENGAGGVWLEDMYQVPVPDGRSVMVTFGHDLKAGAAVKQGLKTVQNSFLMLK